MTEQTQRPAERNLLIVPDLSRHVYLRRDGASTPKASDPEARHTWAEAEAVCQHLGIPHRAPHVIAAPYAPPLPRGVLLRHPYERAVHHQVAIRPEHRAWLRNHPTGPAELVAWLDARVAERATPGAAEGGDLW